MCKALSQNRKSKGGSSCMDGVTLVQGQWKQQESFNIPAITLETSNACYLWSWILQGIWKAEVPCSSYILKQFFIKANGSQWPDASYEVTDDTAQKSEAYMIRDIPFSSSQTFNTLCTPLITDIIRSTCSGACVCSCLVVHSTITLALGFKLSLYCELHHVREYVWITHSPKSWEEFCAALYYGLYQKNTYICGVSELNKFCIITCW